MAVLDGAGLQRNLLPEEQKAYSKEPALKQRGRGKGGHQVSLQIFQANYYSHFPETE